MQRAAAEEDAALGFGHHEVADVLADLGVVAAEQRAVAGERVDQVEDVDGILELRRADRRATHTSACGCCGFAGGHEGRGGQRRTPVKMRRRNDFRLVYFRRIYRRLL